MNVRKIFLSMVLLCAFIHLKAQETYDTSKDFLVWQEGVSLTWDSYKATADSALISDFEALTYVSFLPIGKASDAKVVCVFDARKSWTTSASQSLLQHQQTHFNLGELYARRIRRDLQALLASGELNEQSQLETIEKNYQDYSEDFLKFNEDTSNGIDKVRQKEWSDKINSEIAELSEYKSN